MAVKSSKRFMCFVWSVTKIRTVLLHKQFYKIPATGFLGIFATLQYPPETILQHLNRAEGWAAGSKWGRFWHRPLPYALALGYRALLYPLLRRPWKVPCRLVTGHRVCVNLPAATDLYLLGCKTHPSELRLARFLLRHLQPGNVVLDAGAHVGYFSLVAASRVGAHGQVLAIEPAPEAFALLQQNIRPCPNIRAFQLLLDQNDGERTFYRFAPRYEEFNTTNPAQYTGEAWLQRNWPRAITLPARSGDSLLRQLQQVPGLIKLDVEGHEYDVLLGLQQTLAQHSPVLVLEHAAPGTGAFVQHRQADAWLQQQGYRPHAADAAGTARPLTLPVAQHVAATGWRSDNIIYIR